MGFCFDDRTPSTLGGPCGFLYPTLQRNFFENPEVVGTDLNVTLAVNKVVYFSSFFFDDIIAGEPLDYETWVDTPKSVIKNKVIENVNQYFPRGTEKRNIL